VENRAPFNRNPPANPSSPTPSPESEPQLGVALSLLIAALTGLLRRAWRRCRENLAALAERAGATAAAARPVLRSRVAAALHALARSRRRDRPRPLPVAEPRPPREAVLRVRLPPDRRFATGDRPPRRRHPLLFGTLWASAACFVAVVGFLGYCAYTLPLAGGGPWAEPAPPALVVEDDDGRAFATRGNYRGETLNFKQLPPDLVHAVLAIEDRRFFDHPGIDMWGIGRAAVRDLLSGAPRQGGSTITQQLVRMTYLSPERTLRRKVQEAMLAIWLEARLSKQQILSRYLNTAYFGASAYGVDAAAERYFGKSAQQIDLAEAAMLAGLIRAPSALSPTRNLAAAQARAAEVLQAMVEAGYIDKSQAAAAKLHPAVAKVPPEPEPSRNYFVDTVQAEVKGLLGSPPTDLTVKSTLDPALQDAAERVIARWLAHDGRKRDVGQAALVALAPDGAVLAMVGGRDYNQSQFNRVTEAHRQAGSLFKVFVYLAAFNAGFTPDSVLVDQPVTIGNWQPQDYERRYRGPVTLRTAFADSINTISAQLVQRIGVQRVIDMARSLGVKSDLPAVPSLALATAGVTLYEMTAAMDAIAINSKSSTPYTVNSVTAHGKTRIYAHPETVVKKPDWNRPEIMQLLEAVVQDGTGKAAQLDRPVAGKTGTTNDYRDAWFVGFTTDFVVGVWCGNDDNSPMTHVVGGDLPAKIWHDFIVEAERIRASRPALRQVATAAPADTQQPPAQAPAPEAASGQTLAGVPLVVDTGTLLFRGRLVHLQGVVGENGSYARDMTRYIGDRAVTCEPADAAAALYRCQIEQYDLAEAVLYNGGGRATADAPPELKNAEQEARLAGRGIWQHSLSRSFGD
jgi:penicillin-binding protein 1A